MIHLEFNKIESKAVVDIFHRYLELENIGAVRRWLEENRIPIKRGARRRKNTICGILRHKVYIGYYIYDDIVTFYEEIRLISNETFFKVQKKMKERTGYGPSIHYDKRIERFKDQVFWGNDIDNKVVQDYLARQAERLQCPRCGDNIAVRKWGFEKSPTFGRLQRYNCRPCNYEFIIYPKKLIRNDVECCPKCKSKEFVRKEGKYKPKSGGEVQKYYCNKCRFGGKEHRYWECQGCREIEFSQINLTIISLKIFHLILLLISPLFLKLILNSGGIRWLKI